VRRAAARIVPSKFMAGLLSSTFGNEISCQLIANGVDPKVPVADALVPAPVPEKLQIAVVGALSQTKGLKFLVDVVAALPPEVRVVIIGYVDGQLLPGWLVDGRIWVNGVFEPEELGTLVRSYGCRLAFFPNRQPESYCYALSDAWCAGLPALGPASGAIGERISQTGAGWTFGQNATAEAVATILLRCLRATDSPLERVHFAVAQLLSRREMITALNQHYDALGEHDGRPPALPAIELLAATQLNGVLFRGELKRLSGDLAFAHSRAETLNEALRALGRDHQERGAWIEKIEKDLSQAQQEVLRVETARSLEHDEYVEQVGKLEHDIADTLAETRRLQITLQDHEAMRLQEIAAYAQYVAKLERDIDDTLAEAHRLQNSAQEHEAARAIEMAEHTREMAEHTREMAEHTREMAEHTREIAKLERALDMIPTFIRERLLRRAERMAAQKATP